MNVALVVVGLASDGREPLSGPNAIHVFGRIAAIALLESIVFVTIGSIADFARRLVCFAFGVFQGRQVAHAATTNRRI